VLNHAIKRICADYNKEEKKNAKRDGREPVLIRNFTCHNIRHTFATRICENETNLKAIQDIMGHKDNDEYIRRSNEGGKTKINGQLGG